MKLGSVGFIIAVVLASALFGQSGDIIPKPRSIEAGSGVFSLSKDTRIVASGSAERRSAEILNSVLQHRFGFRLKVTKKTQSNAIVLDDGGYDSGPMGM